VSRLGSAHRKSRIGVSEVDGDACADIGDAGRDKFDLISTCRSTSCSCMGETGSGRKRQGELVAKQVEWAFAPVPHGRVERFSEMEVKVAEEEDRGQGILPRPPGSSERDGQGLEYGCKDSAGA